VAGGGALSNLDKFADGVGLLGQENAEANAIYMHPKVWRDAMKIKEVSGSNKPVVVVEQGGVGSAPRRSLYVIDVYLRSQLATNEGAGTNETSAYVVGTRSLFFVVRQDPRVERDSSRLFNSDESEIRCILRAGVAVVHPKSVCRITGIL
jgi:hypothetical protein